MTFSLSMRLVRLRALPASWAAILLAIAVASLAIPLERADAQVLPGPTAAAKTSQITGAIDDGNLATLQGNPPPSASKATDLGAEPDNFPLQHILMLLKRPPSQEQALEQFIQGQYEPQSADFHRWLTPQQFGALYGPSQEDIQQVSQWLTRHGFVVNRIAPGGTFIDFSGAAGSVRRAFHTEIHRYRVAGENHYANSADPTIPAALIPLVSGFRALNDFHPKPLVRNPGTARFDPQRGAWSRLTPGAPALRAGSAAGQVTVNDGGTPLYLVGPADFAQIYDIKKVWNQTVPTPSGTQNLVGTGQTIGIVGDTDLLNSDIQSFRDQFGLSARGPNGSVVVDHPPADVCPAPDPQFNDLEGYLDSEWAGVAAPDATIDFVACGDTGVTAGTDLAATYIVQDAAHAAQDAVLNSSYGYCEQYPGGEPSEFYVQLWQQAAAEGITVVVATGDAGGAECDEFSVNNYAVQGFGVNAEASTPYNIAAGGTDFSDTFSGTSAQYWRPSNQLNLESAKSYIPEMTWDETCASPLVLQAYNTDFGQSFPASYGADGFCTYASQQPVDPNIGTPPYFFLYAGTGGLSTVSARPVWQQGVTGLPGGNARALPDISLFASSGYAWGHALIFCDSIYSSCDFTNPNNLLASTAGGTSFAAPSFSGIMALVDQKSGSRQGQANYVFYPLAGSQYIDSTDPRKPSLATCAAYLGTGFLSSCYFHDISATPNPDSATQQQTPFLFSTTSVPCTGTATAAGVYTDASSSPASNPEDCYGYQITVTDNGGTLTTTPDYYGILSTADNATSPAFAATPGYDLATGLGSPNVAALVDAPQWAAGGSATVVALSPASSLISPAEALLLTATVATQSGGPPVQGGVVTFFSGSTALGQSRIACNAGGAASLNVTGAAFGGVGVYSDVYAVYAGGASNCGGTAATYFGSSSNKVTVTVALGVAAITGSPVYPATQCCYFAQPYPFSVDVSGGAGAPSGSVQVQSDGVTIGSGVLQPNSTTVSSVTMLLNANALPAGANAVTLLYSGDSDYLPASATSTVTLLNPAVPFGLVPIGRTSTIEVGYTYVQAGAITLNFNPQNAPSTDFFDARGSCSPGTEEPAGHQCTIRIAFAPSQPGPRHGAIQVGFSGQGGANSFYLFPSGIGGAAQISLSDRTQVTLASGLNQPQGVAVNPVGTALYLSNSASAQLVTLPESGGPFTPVNIGGLSLTYPTDLTFDGFGNLLFLDGGFALFPGSTPGRVLQLSPQGKGQVVSTGSIQLSLPAAIRVDGGGNAYVADAGLAELIQLPAQGAAPNVLERSGLNLSFPEGMTLDNAEQNLYVADGNTNQIVEVPLESSSAATNLSLSPCDATVPNCSLNAPSGVVFDLSGNLYIVDAGNYRVLMVPSTHTSGGTPTTLAPFTGLLNPSNIALDGAGNLYVPDSASGNLFALEAAQGTVNFSSQTGTSITVTVTNTGNQDLIIQKLAFALGSRTPFTETNTCAGTTIPSGGQCTVTVGRGTAGNGAKDTLTLFSNAVSNAVISVSAGS